MNGLYKLYKSLEAALLGLMEVNCSCYQRYGEKDLDPAEHMDDCRYRYLMEQK